MHRPSNRAFALIDAAAVLGVVGILVCVAATVLTRPRALASLEHTVSNLKQIADAVVQYGPDSADKAPAFSWTKTNCPSSFADLKTASTDIEAAANQFTDIVRRRSNVPAFAKIASLTPHFSYSHLVLADYLNVPAPLLIGISAEDKNLLKWSSDPSKWQQNGAPNAQSAFRSSYELCFGMWSLTDSGAGAVSQDGLAYNTFSVPTSTVVGQRQLSTIAYPAHKAMAWDLYQRHFGPRVGFFMYDEARVPVALFDGSVSLRAGRNSNNGWKPQAPTNSSFSSVLYQPAATDPPTLSGNASDTLRGRYRWTRRSVLGRDFDAGEIN